MEYTGKSRPATRRLSRGALFLLSSAALVACEAAQPQLEPLTEPLRKPPPEPSDAESAALGISLEIWAGPGFLSHKCDRPDVVFFVRLEPDEELADLPAKPVLIPSTFVNRDNAYLLNARPGKYVAVASLCAKDVGSSTAHWEGLSFEWDDGKFQECNYFSSEMIAKTATTVEAGSFAFMGAHAADQAFFFGGLDDLQERFQKTLEKRGGDELLDYCLELRSTSRDRRAEGAFYDQARELLKTSGWARVIESSMKGLEGTVRAE